MGKQQERYIVDKMSRSVEQCQTRRQTRQRRPGQLACRVNVEPSYLALYSAEHEPRIAGMPLDEVPTIFGRLALLASFHDREAETYQDPSPPPSYVTREISATLSRMRGYTFREWLSLSLEQQQEDLGGYLSTSEGRAAFLSFGQRELMDLLAPADAKAEERTLFQNDFSTNLLLFCNREHRDNSVSPSLRVPMAEIA